MLYQAICLLICRLCMSGMRGQVVFDGRNTYDPKRLRAEGFEHYGVGRN